MPSLADMERVLENLDRRLRGVDLLPTLGTKADLDHFAPKADLESGLAQVRAFTERVRDEVRSLAEGYESLSGRVDSLQHRSRVTADCPHVRPLRSRVSRARRWRGWVAVQTRLLRALTCGQPTDGAARQRAKNVI